VTPTDDRRRRLPGGIADAARRARDARWAAEAEERAAAAAAAGAPAPAATAVAAPDEPPTPAD